MLPKCTIQSGCCSRHPSACSSARIPAKPTRLKRTQQSKPAAAKPSSARHPSAAQPRIPQPVSSPRQATATLPWDEAGGSKNTSCMSGPMYALVLSGGVSRLCRASRSTAPEGSSGLYNEQRGRYTPLHVTAAGFGRHIIGANRGSTAFDIFIHSWHPELQQDFLAQYRRRGNVASAVFEDNVPGEPAPGLSDACIAAAAPHRTTAPPHRNIDDPLSLRLCATTPNHNNKPHHHQTSAATPYHPVSRERPQRPVQYIRGGLEAGLVGILDLARRAGAAPARRLLSTRLILQPRRLCAA